MKTPQTYYSEAEAAKFLGMTAGRLRQHRTAGTGPRYSTLGNGARAAIVYKRGPLARWKRQQENAARDAESRKAKAETQAIISDVRFRKKVIDNLTAAPLSRTMEFEDYLHRRGYRGLGSIPPAKRREFLLELAVWCAEAEAAR